MTFWVHYVVPPGAAGNGLPAPGSDDVIVFAQTLDVDSGGDRTVEFSVFAAGGGFQIATDIDCTALLRGAAEEVAVVRAVDAWVVEHMSRAVRIHELLLYRWHEVCSESHRSSIDALQRWLTAQDPSGDYWRSLGAVTSTVC
ncbi:hypothetical protein [Dactylosporangium sp. NPDC051484]|uniref:hypothetical protein n=1 Tax=Dactylosporangium sp. NPDC051484 TaxID=3154942 RepID=UPI00344E77F2